MLYVLQGPESAFTTSSSNRFSTGGLFSHSMGPGPSYPTRMPSGGSSGPILCLPDGYKPGPQFFEEENPSALSSGPYGYPPSGRASMYSRVIPSGHQSYPPQHHDSSVMKADWSTARMPPPFGHYQ